MIASKAPGNDGHYLGNMKGRITRLVAECGWKYAKDVSPESYQTWVTKQGLSAKALNEYLTSARTLLNWMEKRGRILANPLKSVDLLSTAVEARNPRRALTDVELAKLVDGGRGEHCLSGDGDNGTEIQRNSAHRGTRHSAG